MTNLKILKFSKFLVINFVLNLTQPGYKGSQIRQFKSLFQAYLNSLSNYQLNSGNSQNFITKLTTLPTHHSGNSPEIHLGFGFGF